jgi:hypothetical protein
MLKGRNPTQEPDMPEMRRRRAGLLVAVTLLLGAGPAVAADGEVLISQAQANAGNVTPGDTAGFPITLSRSGKYKLSGSLDVPAGQYGLLITADNVSVDLNGFMIAGTDGLAETGIYARRRNGVTIMNGTISGMRQWGILIGDYTDDPGGRLASVAKLRLTSNGGGLLLGDDARIVKSTISANAYKGIYCKSRCLIEGNVVTTNAYDAAVILSDGGTVLGNVIASNSAGGIAVIAGKAGYGNNVLVGNNGGNAQTSGSLVPFHPNACLPACP